MIELREDDPRAIEAMIHFMYEGEYDSSKGRDGPTSPMILNVRVYRVADKYGVRALKELSKEKFEYSTSTCWDMDDFPHVITDVYETSECKDLRDTVAIISQQHIKALLKKNNFYRVLEETSGFAADLVQLMAEGHPTRAKYQCPSCSATWKAELCSGCSYCCLSCGLQRADWSSYAVSED